MPIIVNNLETEEAIDEYKKWLFRKNVPAIKKLKRMLEIEEKHGLKRRKNVDFRIALMEDEIKRRNR